MVELGLTDIHRSFLSQWACNIQAINPPWSVKCSTHPSIRNIQDFFFFFLIVAQVRVFDFGPWASFVGVKLRARRESKGTGIQRKNIEGSGQS